MHVDLRIHPGYIGGALASWSVAAAGVIAEWPYVFEGALLASVAVLGAGFAVKPDAAPKPKLVPLRSMTTGGALKHPKAKELAGTAAPRPGPRAPPAVEPTGSAADPIPLEVLGVEEVLPAAPPPKNVPWARPEPAGPLMFEGSAPLASESNRRVWAAREPPQPATIAPSGVIHGVCGRCGTRISVANRRPVWATCPVCGHSKLLN